MNFVVYLPDSPKYSQWLSNVNEGPSTCFYSVQDFSQTETYFSRTLKAIFVHAISYATYTPLFLLTLSRFLTMYSKSFQKRLLKFSATKVLANIDCVNFIFIAAVNFDEWQKNILNAIARDQHQTCMDSWCLNGFCNSTQQKQCDLIFVIETSQKSITIFKYIQLILPPLLLIFSNIFAFLLLLKLCQQLKFRAQTNSQNFMASLKIALIIFFQCLAMTFLFFISAFQEYLFYYQNRNYDIEDRTKDMEAILKNWPAWFRFLTLAETIQCFSVIRIFLDSIIILIVLSNYREKWMAFIKLCLTILINPKKAFVQVNSQKNSKVIFISQTSHSTRPLSKASLISRAKSREKDKNKIEPKSGPLSKASKVLASRNTVVT